jgi:hypothetical protein
VTAFSLQKQKVNVLYQLHRVWLQYFSHTPFVLFKHDHNTVPMRFLLSALIIVSFVGCDMFGTESSEPEDPKLGVRSLEEIMKAEDLEVTPGPPVAFQGDTASRKNFRLDGVLQGSTTRFLLQFEASGNRTPRFLMQVKNGGKQKTAPLDYFVQWQETKETLVSNYDKEKTTETVDISNITQPGDTLKVTALQVYPDTTVGLKTVYEYSLSKDGKSAHRAYTINRFGETWVIHE